MKMKKKTVRNFANGKKRVSTLWDKIAKNCKKSAGSVGQVWYRVDYQRFADKEKGKNHRQKNEFSPRPWTPKTA